MSNTIERWFNNKSLSPFRDFSQVQEPFDRLFNEFINLKRTDGMQSMSFNPSCEIAEEDNNYVLRFDLPGVTKDQVKVEADRDQLTIHAERKEEQKSESKKKYLSEMHYGSYTRSFTLPGPVDEKKVDAKFENGVLTVTVPKTESVKAKQIQIQ